MIGVTFYPDLFAPASISSGWSISSRRRWRWSSSSSPIWSTDRRARLRRRVD